MATTLSNLKTAAMMGFLIVLPFVILELTFNKVTERNVAGLRVLFGLLWLLSAGFIFIVIPIVQNFRAGNLATKPVGLLLRITTSALILTMWTGIVMDQMPCFLGVPNCD
jgi:hypothetical protein